MKVVAPLIPILGALGGGKGFLGILREIPGPVGLVATGLGLAAGGFSRIKTPSRNQKRSIWTTRRTWRNKARN